MLLRGLTLRCAFCGSRGLFRGWFNMRETCPSCSHRFNQESGFFLGAYAINFAITEGLLLLALVPYIVLSASNPQTSIPAGPFALAALAGAILGPLLFYPFSRTLWVALDLIFRGGRNLDT